MEFKKICREQLKQEEYAVFTEKECRMMQMLFESKWRGKKNE